jgi:ferric-dicitrate binding protein FerR (iron transport regulator)
MEGRGLGMSEHHEAQTLAQAAEELRDEPLPELDWNSIEERVMQRLESAPPGSDRSILPWALGLGGLAAAAAGVLWLGAGSQADVPREPAPLVVSARPALNGTELAVGEAVAADANAVRVEHAGRAAWTLAPGSRGHLAVRGRFLTVALDRGSLLAEVVPGQASESFAVEAHETRIAAHGTVFRVTLNADQVEVRVTEGEVVIGSAEDRGQTRGFHLAAPGHGTFALDGARMGQISPRDQEAPPETHPPHLLPPTPAAQQHTAPPLPISSAQPQPPPEPTADMATDRLVEKLRNCFVQHTQVHGSVHVSATSTLSVTFSDGSVAALQLNPPLAPDVEQCARSAAHTLDAIPRGEATITREVWLSR